MYVHEVKYKPDPEKIYAVEYTGTNEDVIKNLLGAEYDIDKRPTRLIITQPKYDNYAIICMLGEFLIYNEQDDYLEIYTKENFEKRFLTVKENVMGGTNETN